MEEEALIPKRDLVRVKEVFDMILRDIRIIKEEMEKKRKGKEECFLRIKERAYDDLAECLRIFSIRPEEVAQFTSSGKNLDAARRVTLAKGRINAIILRTDVELYASLDMMKDGLKEAVYLQKDLKKYVLNVIRVWVSTLEEFDAEYNLLSALAKGKGEG